MGLFGGQKRKDEGGEPKTYVVKPGDTLSEIAQRLNVDVLSLEAANVGVTRGRPNAIYPGQVINVPRGYSHKPVLKDKTVEVPAVHVNRGHKPVHVPTLSVDRGHKDVNIPTPTIEGHTKTVTVPTWSLERHDKKVEVPTVSLGKQDHHISVPTAKVSAHSKEVDLKTYSLGTHEKDVHVKVPGVETHRKESGYGSTWNPNTPIPETEAEKRLHAERRAHAGAHAGAHDEKNGGGKFLGIFGGGEKHEASHKPAGGETFDRKVTVPEPRGPEVRKEERKGGFLGFGGGHKNEIGHKLEGVKERALDARDDLQHRADRAFSGIRRFGDKHDGDLYLATGDELQQKKGHRIGTPLLLLAAGVGGYLIWKGVNRGDSDHRGSAASDRKVEDLRNEVKSALNSEAQSANGDLRAAKARAG